MNIICDGDNVVGKTTDIIDYFKKLIIKDIENLDLLDERTLEANIVDIKRTFDLFKRINSDIINEHIDEETYLKISSNPQGNYYFYNKLIEED